MEKFLYLEVSDVDTCSSAEAIKWEFPLFPPSPYCVLSCTDAPQLRLVRLGCVARGQCTKCYIRLISCSSAEWAVQPHCSGAVLSCSGCREACREISSPPPEARLSSPVGKFNRFLLLESDRCEDPRPEYGVAVLTRYGDSG